LFISILAVSGAPGGVTFAQGVAPPATNPSFGPLVVKQLRGNVYWTQGGLNGNNGNTGFVVGDAGVVVIDAKLNAESGAALLAEIAKITPKAVTHVILTHSDGDHVNGLAAFPAGVVILAHEGAKRELDEALADGGRGAPPPTVARAQVVNGNRQELVLDGVNFTLVHAAPAHTSGDLAIFLPDQKVLFTGDLMATTRPEPLVHTEKGGTAAGFITSYQALLQLGAEVVVTGHGALVGNAELRQRMQETESKRDSVKQLIAQGKSLEEIRHALGDAETVPGPGGRGGVPPLTEILYRELK